MPSGNATITYTGDGPVITFSGETFVQGEPTPSTDQGVIGAAKDRDDFKVVDHRANEAPATSSEAASPETQAEAPAAPVVAKSKPAKASSKKH